MTTAIAESRTDELLQISDAYGAHNYHPLPVVIESGKGCYVTDVDGRRYLDMLSAYSALNFGYSHPALIAARSPLHPRPSIPHSQSVLTC